MYIFDCLKPFVHEKEDLKLKESKEWFNRTFIYDKQPFKSVQINVRSLEDDIEVTNEKFLTPFPKCEKRHAFALTQQRKSGNIVAVPGSARHKVPKRYKSSHPGSAAMISTREVQRKAPVSVDDLKSVSRSQKGFG